MNNNNIYHIEKFCLDDIDDSKYCGHLHGLGTNFVNQTAPPPAGVTTTGNSATTSELPADADEKTASADGHDSVDNSSSVTPDNNAAIVTDTNNQSSSEIEQNRQSESDIKENNGSHNTSERNDHENVLMDTSESENVNLVNNSNIENSLSDGSKTKDDSLDDTNNNNSNMCRNGDSQ